MGVQTILIVDDEPGNLAIMGDILANSYKLVFARNGSETLAAVVKHRPAMVLLDIGLPDIDGYALCGRSRKSTQTARFRSFSLPPTLIWRTKRQL